MQGFFITVLSFVFLAAFLCLVIVRYRRQHAHNTNAAEKQQEKTVAAEVDTNAAEKKQEKAIVAVEMEESKK